MNLSARIAAAFNRSRSARDSVVGVAALPAVSRGFKGRGAPAAKLLGLLAISLIPLFATAASASAAPLAAQMGTVSNVSYTSAHVTGKISSPAVGFGGFTTYNFSYSTDQTNWTPGPGGSVGGIFEPVDPFENKEVQGDINVPKGATEYFVRLTVSNNGDEATSPGPNPSFTTLSVEQPTIVRTDNASAVFSQSAKASGKVKRPANPDPAFDVTACRFEYVTDADFTATGFDGAGKADCENFTPITDPNSENGEQEVTAQLTGLKAATTYHLRLAAENAAPSAGTKEAAGTFTTLPAVAKPVVLAVDDATDVSKRTAKVTGAIERPAGADPALDTSCRFEYATEEQFSATGFDDAARTDCVEAPAEAPLTSTSTSPAPVSAELSGLTPETVYHLRLTAENGGGVETKVAAGTFTTLPVIPPSVTIDSVTEIGYQKARVTATVDSGNQGAQYEVEYALAGTDEWFNLLEQGGRGGLGPGAPPLQFSKVLGPLGYVDINSGGAPYDPQPGPGLKPGTTYEVRGGWRDSEEYVFQHSLEPYAEFTTKGTSTPPSASFDPVTAFTATTAHFTGTVDPKAPVGPLDAEGKAAYRTDWRFECTPECKDVNGNPIGGTVEAEEGSKVIAGDAKRLHANTQYEVKLIVSNSVETVETPVQTFSTPLIKPTIKAAPGGSDGKGGYTLQGTVNPNNSPVSACKFEWGPNSAEYAFAADCSPPPGENAQPVTVEAHLSGLNPGVTYHFNLVATNAGGTGESGDQEFTPTLDPAQSCPNEQIRKENNSVGLPECRAYEMVTPPGKEGYGASLLYFNGGDAVGYSSTAGNISRSGQNFVFPNRYVALRTASGWETIPNLNGSSGTLKDAPSYVTNDEAAPFEYSSDLRSSVWVINRLGGPEGTNIYRRNPDGAFTLVGVGALVDSNNMLFGVSEDLSHTFVTSNSFGETPWGPGVYEFIGAGNEGPPRRADVDNSGSPISTCSYGANALFNSGDGRVYAFRVRGRCGGANPPATNSIFARVGGSTTFEVSASQCDRAPSDLGGLCNGPVSGGSCQPDSNGLDTAPGCGAYYEAAAADGSRIFFTTNQQLVNADIDQSRDIYACDIPPGNPAPVGSANDCAALRQVSAGDESGARVESTSYFENGPATWSVAAESMDGSSVAFVAQGVLATNKDAHGENAAAGGHNLYIWHTDAAHPAGQTSFIGRLDSVDVNKEAGAQITPDGRYVLFTTASQLVNTDTDSAIDVYRYAVATGELTRVSVNIAGVGGNGDGVDTRLWRERDRSGRTFPGSHPSISDDGESVVFTTSEALSPADGNSEFDAYLWKRGRTYLISSGSVGGGAVNSEILTNPSRVFIDGTGQGIYFETRAALSPADGDDVGDVYVARMDGGFSFARPLPCSGEACQPLPAPPPAAQAPATTRAPADPGNVKPKTCPKGKVLKGKKCVKKKSKKHPGKQNHGKQHKRAGSNGGGGK